MNDFMAVLMRMMTADAVNMLNNVKPVSLGGEDRCAKKTLIPWKG